MSNNCLMCHKSELEKIKKEIEKNDAVPAFISCFVCGNIYSYYTNKRQETFITDIINIKPDLDLRRKVQDAFAN